MIGFDHGPAPLSATAETNEVGAASQPPFENSWSDSGDANIGPASFIKYGEVIQLVGSVTGGIAGTNAFTLPTGYRPNKDRTFPAVSNGSLGIITVKSTGAVEITVGSPLGVSLSGVVFLSV